VVAGGETSGAVVQALDVRTFADRRADRSGVPATATTDAEPLALGIEVRQLRCDRLFRKKHCVHLKWSRAMTGTPALHTTNEARVREEICVTGASLYQRGYTVGSAGNISARLDDGC